MAYKYDRHNLVEDSTKGRALVNPRSYKRDVMCQVWLESRHLATVMRWLDREGWFVRFKSDIVRTCVEQVFYHIVENELGEVVDFADDARRMLESRFGVDSNNASGKGLRNAAHNMVLDERRREGYVTPPQYREACSATQTKVESSADAAAADIHGRSVKEFVEAATRMFYKKRDEEQLVEADRQTRELMKSGSVEEEVNGESVITPANYLDTPHSVATPEDYEESLEREKERERKARERKEREKKQRKRKREREELEKKLAALEEEDSCDEGSCEIRVRSQEEIEEYRKKRDEEKERELKEMPIVPMLDNSTK